MVVSPHVLLGSKVQFAAEKQDARAVIEEVAEPSGRAFEALDF